MIRSQLPIALLLAAATTVAACDKGETNAAETKTAKAESKTPPSAKTPPGDKADDKADEKQADGKTPAADDAKADDAKAPEEPTAPGGDATPTTVKAGEPGPAYFAVRDKGVFVLDGGKFAKVEDGPDKLVKEIHMGADGGVYLLGFKGILRLGGTKAELVAETDFQTTGTVEAIAATKDGKFWAVGYKGISHWDGSKWDVEDKKVLGDDVKLIKGVAVDGQDRVWVASSNKLHLRDGDKWTTVELSKKLFKRQPFFDSVALGPDQVAHAVASDKFIRIKAPDAIDSIKATSKRFSSLRKLAFSASGVAVLETQLDVVTRIMPDGSKTTYKAKKDFAADRVVDVTPDDQGRVWIASDAGVAILGPGDERVEWKSGSVDELAGQVEVIGVIGSGPELPGVGPVKKGGLKGKVLREGAGVATTDVELCPKPKSLFRKSPCAESPTRFAGTTDADGNFEFKDVPLGAYGLAVKVDGKWQLTFGSEFGSKMKEGKTFDIGSIEVK